MIAQQSFGAFLMHNIQAQSPERKTMNEPQNAIKVLNLDHLYHFPKFLLQINPLI